jgi:hypothetical protein
MAATNARTRTTRLAVLVTINLLEDQFTIHRMLGQRIGLRLYYSVDISLYVFAYRREIVEGTTVDRRYSGGLSYDGRLRRP